MRLLWQEDAAQRGIFLGREGAWSKSGKRRVVENQQASRYFLMSSKTPIFLHTTYRHFENHDELDEEETTESESQTAYAPTPSIALSHFGALPSNEAYLLHYFVSAICPNCSLSPTDNPYLRYVAPMALVFPPLRHAVISIAATERRNQNDRRFETEAWLYKSQAIQGLQATIASGTISWPFIATVLMLTFGDIADGCNDSWRTHLRGGLAVLNDVRADCTEALMLRRFCLMYFIAHDIMGHTAGGTSHEMTPYSWLDDDDIEEIDPLMGCSRGLLDIINRITALSSSINRVGRSRVLTANEVKHLHESRSQLERALHNISQRPSLTSTKSNIALVAEAKRTTAFLYLHYRFRSVPSTPNETEQATEAISIHIPGHIDTLISQLKPLPVTPTLLWPLFVLGNLSPNNEEHRRFVLERLGIMLKERNLGSIRLAKRLMERRFRTWDLGQACDMDVVSGKRVSLA